MTTLIDLATTAHTETDPESHDDSGHESDPHAPAIVRGPNAATCTLSPEALQQFADGLAKDIHQGNLVSCLRTAIPLHGLNVILVVNAHPYAAVPRLRDEELKKLEQETAALGVATLARASYPPAGDHRAHYTRVLLFEGDADVRDIVWDCYGAILRQSGELFELIGKSNRPLRRNG